MRRLFLIVVGSLGVVAIADGAWAANSAVRGLTQVRDQLQLAAGDLIEGRLGDASTRFELARSFANQASGLTRHPAAALADVLPFLGDDVDAIQTMAGAVDHVADAGESLVRAAREAGWDGTGLPGADLGGQIPLEPFELAAPYLEEAADDLALAERIVDGVDTDSLLGPVRDAAVTVQQGIAERRQAVEAAGDVASFLPQFLGGDEPRTYFLAFQNLSSPRGTGGFLGLYGILRAEDGDIQLETLAHTSTLGTTEGVRAPPDVVARYERFGALSYFYAANYSPDFPTTGRLILDMWEASGRDELDGVIAADPVWIADLLQAIGPVSTPAWPEPLTPQNVSEVLHRDTFLLPGSESDRAQEALGLALWSALLERPPQIRGLADAASLGVRERHLLVYSRQQEEQELVCRLGACGEVRLGENPLFVVWQDAVSSRAGFFAHKTTWHRVTIEPDGSATVRTEVTLENRAVEGPPSVLLGSGTTGDPIGYFAALVNVYLPDQATDVQSEVGSGLRLGLLEEEFGRPVAMELLGAGPGETNTMDLSYRVPDAVRRMGDGNEYRIDFLPQAALRPDRVVVEVTLPQGARLRGAAPGAERSGGTVRWDLTLSEPRAFWLRWA